jgi:hypothetical protein
LTSTIQRAHSAASIDDAEEAAQTAAAELWAKGTPLTAPNVVTRARSRLRDRFNRREARNLSLDAFREEDIDEPSIELAVIEVDFDSHVQLAEVQQHPVTARKLALLQFGGAPRIMRRGAASRLARYSDEQVNRARALRDSGMTYPDISARSGCLFTRSKRGAEAKVADAEAMRAGRATWRFRRSSSSSAKRVGGPLKTI